MPAQIPGLDHASLHAYIGGRAGRRIGTTVTVGRVLVDPGITFVLYETRLATIYPDRVDFDHHGDTHQLTSSWLGRIVRDNKLGAVVCRIRPRSGFPGAGILTIDGDRDKPIEGRTYTTKSGEL